MSRPSRPRSGFPREPASGGENGVLTQLSFDDLFADAPVEEAAPRRLLDPAEVAARCGLSYAPSPEQALVVAAPADRPLVVVAGAGSGKTETMAARVSWLVANRLVEPEASWYGIDPIHLRRACRREAWERLTGISRSPVLERSLLRLPLLGAETLRLAGRTLRTEQPVRRLADGSTVALY